ncbi:MucR family transcriptional regulator [Methylobacterium sp. V23]|jgi:predicted transcriptional regulator|uniref:MucR family transcriptional regulator n=1 Tax=Methylobacterium sp. V23 TaxID=2044878 RepID=UPI000CDA7D90|nr:MucR family transcriptional regulator [Methylobacterium sp. V23]POR40453.1 MucR family transcriptional regulator [Methylobacterium sp. V23]
MDDQTVSSQIDFLDLTAELVSAYVAANSVPASELPALMTNVHAALSGLTGTPSTETSKTEKATPAQIRKSIALDTLISFEDGKPYKTLRRHLTLRGLSPEAYREKWGLPPDYPMTSAAYSAHRSELARSLGLGQQRRGRLIKTVEAIEEGDKVPGEA